VSQLLGDERALIAECNRLVQASLIDLAAMSSEEDVPLPAVGPQHHISLLLLQLATQRLIDQLGCRHPQTLERLTAVYSRFASRHEGLTALEFQGYIACVLTQLQHELAARCAAAGILIQAPDDPEAQGQEASVVERTPHSGSNQMMSAGDCLTAPSSTVCRSEAATHAARLDNVSESIPTMAQAPLSELQVLTLQLSALQESLSRIGQGADSHGTDFCDTGPVNREECPTVEPLTTGLREPVTLGCSMSDFGAYSDNVMRSEACNALAGEFGGSQQSSITSPGHCNTEHHDEVSHECSSEHAGDVCVPLHVAENHHLPADTGRLRTDLSHTMPCEEGTTAFREEPIASSRMGPQADVHMQSRETIEGEVPQSHPRELDASVGARVVAYETALARAGPGAVVDSGNAYVRDFLRPQAILDGSEQT